jgi:hypothetical protein
MTPIFLTSAQSADYLGTLIQLIRKINFLSRGDLVVSIPAVYLLCSEFNSRNSFMSVFVVVSP